MADMKKTDAGTKTGWAKLWGNFEEKHPKLAKWLYQIFYFFVFSMGVTIIQYLFFTFMPGILGEGLAGTEFMWPQVHMDIFGVEFTWSLLGYNVLYDEAGAVGSFVAQCINFPLQRNITFKSHGNVAYQAMWYFIAWIVISLICNGFNNLWMPIAAAYVAPAVYNILVTIITGGVSMVIFFFVFKIIFPEGEAKKK